MMTRKMNTFELDDEYLSLVDQHEPKTMGSSPLFQTKEERSSDSQQDVILESLPFETYDLSYTCLLLPRFPSHQIKGDLAGYLNQWLQQVCISYGWRLEFITTHPDYLQWGKQVNASTPSATFMQIIRGETSKLILSNFGRIAQENLSDDFWAPGHLVVFGIRPHPTEMIDQYIRMTRRRQGLHTL